MECRRRASSSARASPWPANGQSPALRATVKRRLPRVRRVTSRPPLRSTFISTFYSSLSCFHLHLDKTVASLRFYAVALGFPGVRAFFLFTYRYFLSFPGRSVGSAFFLARSRLPPPRRVQAAPIFSARPSFPKPARAIFPLLRARPPVSPPDLSWPWRATNGALRQAELRVRAVASGRLRFCCYPFEAASRRRKVTPCLFKKLSNMLAFDRTNSDAAVDLPPS